jgi:hypothetical protein
MAGKPAPPGGASDGASNHTLSAETTHQRHHGKGHEAGPAPVADADAKATLCKDVDLKGDDIEDTIRSLPSWQSQLSLRGYIVGESRKTPRTAAARENKG